jgi:predicted AAA+ superfamily ATPase
MDRQLSGYQWIYIDEGQKIPNIGNILKMMIDAYGDTKQIIVTGSSSLHLLDTTNEPLTGRKRVHKLYPIAWQEYIEMHGLSSARKDLEKLLIFGAYPEVLSYSTDADKIQHLREITSGQLYRDILEFQDIKKSGVIVALLELLALRIGSEISYHSLGQILGISQITVERYIDLLEKSFVIFRVRPYFTNKEKEIVKMKKIYFYDLGVRNAILRAYQPLTMRSDVGALFENFFVLERLKKLSYEQSLAQIRFWRTHKQQEVDLLEVTDRLESAYEVKWQSQLYVAPTEWQAHYHDITPRLITRDNFWEFL